MKYFDAFSGYGGFHLGIERAFNDNNLGRTTGTSDTEDGWNMPLSAVSDGVGRRTHADCIGYSEIDKYASAVYKYQFGRRNENLRCLQSKNNEVKQDSDNAKDKLQQRKLSNNNRGRDEISGIKDKEQQEGVGSEKRQYSELDNKRADGLTRNFGDITKINPTDIEDFDLFVGGFPCQSFSIAGKRGGFEDTRGTLIFDVFRILKEKQPRFVLLENVKGLLSHDNGRTFKVIISSLAELGYDVEWQVLNAKNFGVPQNRERVFIIGHLGGFSGRQVFPIGEESCPTYIKLKGNCNPSGRGQSGGVFKKDGLFPTIGAGGGNPRRKRDIGWSSGYLEENMKIRRLTPTECERLMGLPDGWTSKGDFDGEIKEISDTQRYKLCGNGVCIPVVQAIVERLFISNN
jgi:DNA (cytosine-5)-methyltransferase 1